MAELNVEKLKRVMDGLVHRGDRVAVFTRDELQELITALEDLDRLRAAAWDVLNNTGTGDRALMRRRLRAALEDRDG